MRQLLVNRSLWLDEALVADSIVRRGFSALATQPLLHDQAAPLLWVWLERAAVDAFGPREWALRLVPVSAGLAVLVLVWRVGRRLLPPGAVPAAVLLAALSPSLLYYSTEVKPYESDAAAVLLVALLALRVRRDCSDRGRLLALTLVGAAAVWLSTVAVLALAGVSVVVVVDRLVRRRWRAGLEAAALLAVWVASFAVEYVLLLAPLRRDPVLVDYWSYAFPLPGEGPGWLSRTAADLAASPLHVSVPALGLAATTLGALLMLRRHASGAIVLLAPVVAAVAAGAWSVYPLAGRLALPLVAPVALSLASLLPGRLGQRRGIAAALALAALAVTNGPAWSEALPLAVTPRYVEELRPVLEELRRERADGEPVLVDLAAISAFDYYARVLAISRDGAMLFVPASSGGRCHDRQALDAGGFPTRRVWLVLSHRLVDAPRLGSREDLLTRISAVTSVARHIVRPGAEAYLFDPSLLTSPKAPAPPNPARCLAVYLGNAG
ncbi:MAG: glycosyltransferase family 39 protein [Actinomycetota bacterium]|nr:glycosyltransferase family 39 protein [Actinomycetota bacterium]